VWCGGGAARDARCRASPRARPGCRRSGDAVRSARDHLPGRGRRSQRVPSTPPAAWPGRQGVFSVPAHAGMSGPSRGGKPPPQRGFWGSSAVRHRPPTLAIGRGAGSGAPGPCRRRGAIGPGAVTGSRCDPSCGYSIFRAAVTGPPPSRSPTPQNSYRTARNQAQCQNSFLLSDRINMDNYWVFR